MVSALGQLEKEKKERENLRDQLEQAIQENQPLKDKLSDISGKFSALKNELDSKETQLKSARAYTSQLNAELQVHINKKDESEKLQRDLLKAQKEIQSK